MGRTLKDFKTRQIVEATQRDFRLNNSAGFPTDPEDISEVFRNFDPIVLLNTALSISAKSMPRDGLNELTVTTGVKLLSMSQMLIPDL